MKVGDSRRASSRVRLRRTSVTNATTARPPTAAIGGETEGRAGDAIERQTAKQAATENTVATAAKPLQRINASSIGPASPPVSQRLVARNRRPRFVLTSLFSTSLFPASLFRPPCFGRPFSLSLTTASLIAMPDRDARSANLSQVSGSELHSCAVRRKPFTTCRSSSAVHRASFATRHATDGRNVVPGMQQAVDHPVTGRPPCAAHPRGRSIPR